MPLTLSVIASAPALAAGVVQDWGSVAELSPNLNVPRPVDEDGLEELIRCLGEAADAKKAGGNEPARALVRAALHHGRERRADGFTPDMVLYEYHLVRRVLWNELKKIDPDLAPETILRVDAEITTATSASLQGYYIPSSDADDEIVDRVVSTWPI